MEIRIGPRRPAFALAGLVLSTAALAACTSSSESASSDGKTPNLPAYNVQNGIVCEQIVPNDVLLDCKARGVGTYSLYLFSYNDATDRPIASYHIQSPSDTFSLIPTKPYKAYCGEAFVTRSDALDEVAKEELVYDFEVCDNDKVTVFNTN